MTTTKKEKINNTQLLKDTGLRIRHFHSFDKCGYPRLRNLTVAYKEGSSNLEIATAVVHPADTFCKKVGTKLAIESFVAGHTVRVPKVEDFMASKPGRPASPNTTLSIMFG